MSPLKKCPFRDDVHHVGQSSPGRVLDIQVGLPGVAVDEAAESSLTPQDPATERVVLGIVCQQLGVCLVESMGSRRIASSRQGARLRGEAIAAVEVEETLQSRHAVL